MSIDRSLAKRWVVEGLVITLSILAAFAIDAWWDVSQEHKRIRAALVTLENGFVDHLSRIDERVNQRSADDDLLYRFVLMEPVEAGNIHPDSTYAFVQALHRTTLRDLGISFLVSAIEGAGLEALENSELDRAVAAWLAQVARLEERHTLLLTASGEVVRAVNRHPEVRLGHARPIEVVDVMGAESLVYSGVAMRRLRADEDVMAAAGAKSFESRIHLRVLRQVRSSAELVHGLLQKELAN